jgi:cytochrome c-type biogenesis protein CcmE
VKPKSQRMVLIGVAGVAVIVAGLLIVSGLQQQAAFFYAPGDIAKSAPPLGKDARLGGMVADKSIKRDQDGVTIRFIVEDGIAQVPVVFTGIAPDLFKEKSGVVAEGRFQADGSFRATNLLAKHDERYMPPELDGKMHKTGSLKQ